MLLKVMNSHIHNVPACQRKSLNVTKYFAMAACETLSVHTSTLSNLRKLILTSLKRIYIGVKANVIPTWRKCRLIAASNPYWTGSNSLWSPSRDTNRKACSGPSSSTLGQGTPQLETLFLNVKSRQLHRLNTRQSGAPQKYVENVRCVSAENMFMKRIINVHIFS